MRNNVISDTYVQKWGSRSHLGSFVQSFVIDILENVYVCVCVSLFDGEVRFSYNSHLETFLRIITRRAQHVEQYHIII